MSDTNQGPGTALARPDTAELANRRMDGGLTTGNGIITPARWQMLAAIAETVKDTEFVPKGLRGRGPAVMAALLYGDSLGLHPSSALKGIDVIEGEPTVDAALAVSLIRRAGHRLTPEQLVNDAGAFAGFIAHGERGDDGTTFSFTYTLEMAARAGLIGKNNWKHYPEAMCWARAATQLARILFPDVFMGALYDGEELEPAAPMRPPSEEVVDAEAVEAADPPVEAEEPGPAEEPAPDPADEPGGKEPDGTTPPAEDGDAAASDGRTTADTPEPDAPVETPEAAGDEGAEGGGGEARAGETPDSEPVREATNDGADPADTAGESSQFAIPTLTDETTTEEVAAGVASTVMLYVAQAVERGDVRFVEGVIAHEQGRKQGPRKLLSEQLMDALNHAKVTRDELEAAGAEVPPLEDNPLDEPALVMPALPSDSEQPARRPSATRVRAACAWMAENMPAEQNWRLPALVKSAGSAWGDRLPHPVHRLEDLTDEMLDAIYGSLPIVAREALAKMSETTIELLAETTEGGSQ